MDNYPYGLASFGIPLVGGLPLVPTVNPGVYFVSGDYGSDGYTGQTPLLPFKTLDRAYNACVGGNNEIIFVIAGASSVNFSSAIASGGAGLNWSKNFTHLIGLGAPGLIGQRAHISNGPSTNLYTPFIAVSGDGCLFQNLKIFNGGADTTKAAVCLQVVGDNNAFRNCQISGGGNATAAGNAACRSLVIGGAAGIAADENLFAHCNIGLDTISRASTSSEVEFLGASARTVFEDCVFSTYGTGGQFFLKAAANGIDRFALFRHCQFINPYTFSGGTILTDAFSIVAAPGGLFLFNDFSLIGATNLSAADTAIFVDNAYAGATSGKSVVASW